MQTLRFRIEGVDSLLLNNPQTVDPTNDYAREKKKITGKRTKTDEDLENLRRLDVASKTYFDSEMGVYVPSTWIIASIAGTSWSKSKISKANIRSGVFMGEPKIKLNYAGQERVRTLDDISGNPEFQITQILKQGQVRIAKNAPIFHNWSFETELEFDPSVIDRQTLIDILTHAASYGGFGDFRPTYGRARFVEINEQSQAA
jgi:hypothetical protein